MGSINIFANCFIFDKIRRLRKATVILHVEAVLKLMSFNY